MNNLEILYGEGFISDLIDYLKETPKMILRKRPKIINDLLVSKGDVEIISIRICRTEIKSSIKNLMDIVTFGQLKIEMKKLNYDKLFHLYMIIYLKDGSKIGIEKNERVRIWNDPKLDINSECVNSNIKSVTLKKFIENGEKRGGKEFYRYSSYKNNCQKFVNDLLVSNGITKLSNFVLQDVKNLFTDIYKKLFQGVTDFAGIARYIYEGGKKN